MRKLSLFLIIFGLLIVGVGCDSNDDEEESIEAQFAGSWALTGVSDADGDQSATFAQNFDSVVVTFQEAGDFTIAVDAKIDEADVTIPGTFTVNEASESITLNAQTTAGTIPLAFDYNFTGNQIMLSAGAQTVAALNPLFGTTLEAPATITVSSVSQ